MILLAKTCTGCWELVMAKDFHRHPNGLGGRTNQCKSCKSTYLKGYRAIHGDEMRAYDKARYPQRAYSTLSEEQKERRRRQSATYRAAHSEAVKETKRRYRLERHAELLERLRHQHAENPEPARATWRRYTQELRRKIFDHYGWSCECCGLTQLLSIDHVNGNGAEHRRQLLGANNGSQINRFYRWLISEGFPAGFQTLCMPCNASKKRGDTCRLHNKYLGPTNED